jgi:hypothetical protein
MLKERLLHVAAGLAIALAAVPACGAPFERVADSGFPTDRPPWFRRAFDVVAADMDLDGDPDLLVNWHHHEPLELYENVGGRLQRIDTSHDDTSGLFDNPGVPQLFADQAAMQARIAESGRPGLYVWHDRNRAGFWRFLWRPPAPDRGLAFRTDVSLPIEEVEGLRDGESERVDVRALRVALPAGAGERALALRVRRVATQLKLRFPGDPRPPVFAGATMNALSGAEPELWKPDPHGIAWVDARGDAHPELFITRGSLGGELVAPAAAKTDRYFVRSKDPRRHYRRAETATVPASYGRGRRVAWVDVDGDGSLSLSVANEASPNTLWVADVDSGRLSDAAPARGLALHDAAVQAWSDFDGDGRQDLFFVDEGRIDVMLHSGAAFERKDGRALGLTLPAAKPHKGVVDPAALRFADFDNDGDLDLWLFAHAEARSTRLFERDGERFVDATRRVGLADANGFSTSVLLDFDNDGFEDIASFGQRSVLWHNRPRAQGRGFEPQPLPGRRVAAAVACDVDGDGWTDLIAMARQRLLLRNAGGSNRHLTVALRAKPRAPIGAVVRAHYRDGRVRAQRYGSAASSAFSQALLPLHFGVPVDNPIVAVGVVWPGQRTETRYPVDAAARHLAVERTP